MQLFLALFTVTSNPLNRFQSFFRYSYKKYLLDFLFSLPLIFLRTFPSCPKSFCLLSKYASVTKLPVVVVSITDNVNTAFTAIMIVS